MTETNLQPMKRGPGRPPKAINVDPLAVEIQKSLANVQFPPTNEELVRGIDRLIPTGVVKYLESGTRLIPILKAKFIGQGVQLDFNGRAIQTFTVDAPENKSRGITLHADCERRVLVFKQEGKPPKLVPFERVEFMELAE